MITNLGKAHVELAYWNILRIELPTGEHGEFFVGYSLKDGLGRFSTKIADYDEETGMGTTASGSTYQTHGPAGLPHDDAIYVMESKFGRYMVKQELFSENNTGVLSFIYPLQKDE